MAEIITIADDTEEVSCDGGGGPLGHPKVWYELGDRESCVCGYCGRLFIKKRAAARQSA